MQDQPTKAPRRVKSKAPGVYRSISGKYEIAYRDTDGRLVFRVEKVASRPQGRAG